MISVRKSQTFQQRGFFWFFFFNTLLFFFPGTERNVVGMGCYQFVSVELSPWDVSAPSAPHGALPPPSPPPRAQLWFLNIVF